jgi:hypothetical protein
MTGLQKIGGFFTKHTIIITILFAMIMGALCFVSGVEYQKRVGSKNLPPMMQQFENGRGDRQFGQGQFREEVRDRMEQRMENRGQQLNQPQQPAASPAAQLNK